MKESITLAISSLCCCHGSRLYAYTPPFAYCEKNREAWRAAPASPPPVVRFSELPPLSEEGATLKSLHYHQQWLRRLRIPHCRIMCERRSCSFLVYPTFLCCSPASEYPCRSLWRIPFSRPVHARFVWPLDWPLAKQLWIVTWPVLHTMDWDRNQQVAAGV